MASKMCDRVSLNVHRRRLENHVLSESDGTDYCMIGGFIFCCPLFPFRREDWIPFLFPSFSDVYGVWGVIVSLPPPLVCSGGGNILWLIMHVMKRKTKITMGWLLG